MKSQRFGRCFVNVDVYPTTSKRVFGLTYIVTLSCAQYLSDAVFAYVAQDSSKTSMATFGESDTCVASKLKSPCSLGFCF